MNTTNNNNNNSIQEQYQYVEPAPYTQQQSAPVNSVTSSVTSSVTLVEQSVNRQQHSINTLLEKVSYLERELKRTLERCRILEETVSSLRIRR